MAAARATALSPSVCIHTSHFAVNRGAQCTRYCTRYSQPTAKMKLAVCVLLAANGALALTPPKSAVAATRTGSALEPAVLAAKEVSAVPRGGVIANFVGVDVALLSYFFFWYLGNYYCPRPVSETTRRRRGNSTPSPRRQKLRGAMDSVSDFESGGCGFESRRSWRHRREFDKTHAVPPRVQTTSRTSSRSRTAAAPRASP